MAEEVEGDGEMRNEHVVKTERRKCGEIREDGGEAERDLQENEEKKETWK